MTKRTIVNTLSREECESRDRSCKNESSSFVLHMLYVDFVFGSVHLPQIKCHVDCNQSWAFYFRTVFCVLNGIHRIWGGFDC